MSTLDEITLRSAKVVELLRPKRRLTRFTVEDDLYLVQEWQRYTPVQEIAKAMGRSPGVLRQRIYHYHPELRHIRDGTIARAVRSYGRDILNAASAPRESVDVVRRRKIEAYAAARAAAQMAKQAFCGRCIQEMHAAIAAGEDRNETIFAARTQGVTLQSIGRELNLTRERVRQICERVAFNRAMRAEPQEAAE